MNSRGSGAWLVDRRLGKPIATLWPRCIRGFQQLRDIVSMVGFVRALWIVPRWAVHRQYWVLVKEVEEPQPPKTHAFTRWTVLTDKDAASLVRMNPTLTEEELRRRRHRGAVCYLFWVGDRLAHYRWLSDTPVYLPFLGKTFVPAAKDYLVAEVFTHPDFRNKGILAATSQWCLYRAHVQGFAHSVAIVACWNEPSLAVAQRKANRHPVGKIHVWKLGPWTHISVSGDLELGEHETIFIRPLPAS